MWQTQFYCGEGQHAALMEDLAQWVKQSSSEPSVSGSILSPSEAACFCVLEQDPETL